MKKQIIEEFINSRPSALGVYGYGSANFKQAGYTGKEKSEIDLKFVVDDLTNWSKENVSQNEKQFTRETRSFFKKATKEQIEGKYGLYFLISIPFEEYKFKLMVVSKESFIRSNLTYDQFLVAGRTQKLMETYISTEELDQSIDENRTNAAKIGLLLNDNEVEVKDYITSICGLSYAGDIRMKFGENPNKVKNLVNGSFEEYKEIYIPKVLQFTEIENDKIKITEEIKSLIPSLPQHLKEIISNEQDIIKIREIIINYFASINKEASRYLIHRGFQVNGIERTIKYGTHKVLKRFRK